MTTTYANGTKNAATFANGIKHDADYNYRLRHGHEPLIGDTGNHEDIGDFTFEDKGFEDDTLIENITFDQLTDQAWSNQPKN